MLLSKIIQRFSYQLIVKEEATELQMEFNVREHCDDLIMQELSVHTIAMDVIKSHINEITLLLVDDIVVANQLLTLLDATNFIEALNALLRI